MLPHIHENTLKVLIGEFLKKHARRVGIGARFEEYGSLQHPLVWRVKIHARNADKNSRSRVKRVTRVTGVTRLLVTLVTLVTLGTRPPNSPAWFIARRLVTP